MFGGLYTGNERLSIYSILLISFFPFQHKHVNIEDKNMACIIHYKSLGNSSEMKHVTTNTYIGLREAKAIKERIQR